MWIECRAHRGVLPKWLSVRHSELHVVIWLDPGSDGDQGAPELRHLVAQFLPRGIVGSHRIWCGLVDGLGCFCGVRYCGGRFKDDFLRIYHDMTIDDSYEKRSGIFRNHILPLEHIIGQRLTF